MRTSRRITANKSRHAARWLSSAACTVGLILVSACDTSESIPEAATSEDVLVSEAAETFEGDVVGSSPETAGDDIEVAGVDTECPFISTDAVVEATGMTRLERTNFGPNLNTQGEYICTWDDGTSYGQAVHMLVRNGGGGWGADQLENPNFWGEAPGREYLQESVGPMGGFLEVWTSEDYTSNYVYGDQTYTARGPFTIDDSMNPFSQIIFAWYTNGDPATFDETARALLEATDETYIPAR